MGPENCETEDFVLYTADGQRMGKIRGLPEVTVQTGKENDAAMSCIMAELSATFDVKIPKQWKCKGRKRFIKLLMSKGTSRNGAEIVARLARIAGTPYRDLWQGWYFWQTDVRA